MSLGQSGCAGGFIPLPAVIVQAVAVPPMGLYRRSLYRLCISFTKGATASARTTQSPYEQGNSYE